LSFQFTMAEIRSPIIAKVRGDKIKFSKNPNP